MHSLNQNKTVFEGKQMILVIAPFFAITFFACSNDQSNENIWKIIWKLTEFTNLHTNLLGRKS